MQETLGYTDAEQLDGPTCACARVPELYMRLYFLHVCKLKMFRCDAGLKLFPIAEVKAHYKSRRTKLHVEVIRMLS